jgi:hypothetical protein
MPNAFLVASPTGAMSATGTGQIESQQYTSAAHTGITHEFRTTRSKTSDLFTAFSWQDVNTELNTDVSSGQTNFTIALDYAKFHAALKDVIESALGGKANSSFSFATNQSSVPAAEAYTDPSNLNGVARTAENILDREIRLEVETELNANGVLEYLEGDSLGYFDLYLDASGGATDMFTKLSATAALRNLFLQIPNRLTEVAESDVSGGRLPVATGDAIAFVFSVTPSVSITQTTESGDAQGSAAGNAAEPLGTVKMGGSDTAVMSASILNTDPRKIAFVVTVS